MDLYEFNQLDLEGRYKYIYLDRGVSQRRFVSYRKDDHYMFTLWDCGGFFIEMKCSKSKKKVISIEGFELYYDRINLYIDFAKGMDQC